MVSFAVQFVLLVCCKLVSSKARDLLLLRLRVLFWSINQAANVDVYNLIN